MTLLLLMAAMAVAAPESCAAVVIDDGVRRTEPYALDLAADTPLATPPEGARAILCERDSIVPGPHDDRVLIELKLPLLIRSGGRTGMLELHEGQFVYGIVGDAKAGAD